MRIFLDAGHNHSGADTGAAGNGLKEQDVTYYIAQLVGALLLKLGIEVKYSRNNLTDNVGTTLYTSISGRYGLANSWGADYFVSIHCNAAADEKANGTETLVYSLGGKVSELAAKVNSQLVSLGLTNRGVKVRTNLGVLKNSNMPAILVETAFITNIGDAKILSEKQDNLANAIFKGICDYLGVKGVDEMADANNAPWYNDAQYWVKENGISDGTRPTEPVTRAEVWQMLYEMAQLKK